MILNRYVHPRIQTTLLLLILICVCLPSVAKADYFNIIPPKPQDFEFISDYAEMLTESDKAALQADLKILLSEMAIPIIVVTINSMSQYGADDMKIEAYAKLLFDNWGIGYDKVKVEGRGMGRSAEISWNKGILLLISKYDRKARIELGADYGTEKNMISQQIMGGNIIPYFKNRDFPGGIKSGVEALSKMARGEKIPNPPRPAWHYLLMVGGICLAIFTITSLARRGTSGWAWVFWGLLLAFVGGLIWHILTTAARRPFDGGGFGGGSSGGGGATGSW